jgi:hypothetical protein
MERLAAGALAILDVAANGLRAGHTPSELTFLVGRDETIRIIADSDWSLTSLQREYGARSAYRVYCDGARVRVQGVDLCKHIEFHRDITTAGPCQPVQFLPGPRREPLRLSESRALLTGPAPASATAQ